MSERLLAVELYGMRLGTVKGDDRRFDFEPERDAIEAFGLGSTVLSESVPLNVVTRPAGWKRRQNYFIELLPEGEQREWLATEAGLRPWQHLSLLTEYGRDVAGAVQLWDLDDPGEPRTPRLRPLDDSGVAEVLRNRRAMPLGNVPHRGKSSLVGVQPKVVLARVGGTWNGVEDGYPSTHILKPVPEGHPALIFNEEYGSRIARSLGLLDYEVVVSDFAGEPALVIERYDRDPALPDGRLHQEDMSQALGAQGNEKYQRFGGKVTLRRIAQVFSSRGDADSLARLARHVALSVATGNLDAHAKNVSMIHRPDGRVTLAPAYDIVPQAHESNDGEMALAVNDRYVHAAITADDLISEVKGWGAIDARAIVLDALDRVAHAVETLEPHPHAHRGVAEDVAGFTRNLLRGDPAGRAVSAASR
ncbi:serine/threonine-protein kinase HipA [Leifsonia sp. 98AMF]|uniref:type II toxin-antitoxin system HipA family toxin n=1 Tax=unclassified Leifsonia TaxID=2663824 RepID=UPI00087D41BC|nr:MULTISPECIES: HipA domain-containing protein [unclassified Leifsonia]SDH17052.1 serine/threonine-protein kinase HipA [Leifsonia sp. 197AMF]SDJ21281.1 serine/threonine-protein kinase HipA [Leifsonia sp. 466MF]SDJ43764.1 serine/threonine-protein kinase HipA [Leifsonia sp. 157MF]SDN42911.1 serine/threonine-protein kinase HipA [Leifsonia sp. 509MF]SEM77483.1 serine/threonine-protein kinase HipA [Leifsonia sp. 467MF]